MRAIKNVLKETHFLDDATSVNDEAGCLLLVIVFIDLFMMAFNYQGGTTGLEQADEEKEILETCGGT